MPVLIDINFNASPDSLFGDAVFALLLDEQGNAIKDADAPSDEYWAAFMRISEQDE
jgi:hypothetical protein